MHQAIDVMYCCAHKCDSNVAIAGPGYGWVSVKLQELQCISIGVIAVLHWANDMLEQLSLSVFNAFELAIDEKLMCYNSIVNALELLKYCTEP